MREGARRNLGAFLWGAAVAGVLATELTKPGRKRTWQGRLAGVIPYDFRPPSRRRFEAAIWNPRDPHLLKPQPFGVGWTVNLGRLARLLHLV
jgi:hypothetical protein